MGHHLRLIRENLRNGVSNAVGSFDFVIRTAEGKSMLVVRDLVLSLDQQNPDRQIIERAFEARYTLLMSVLDVFAMLAFPSQVHIRNFAYGTGHGGTVYKVQVGMAHTKAGKTGHAPTFGMELPGFGWFCIGPIFNSCIHADLPIVPANPPSSRFRMLVRDTNILVRNGSWFTFGLSSVGGLSAFSLKNAGMLGTHMTDESVYAAVFCEALLEETELMKAFSATVPGSTLPSASRHRPNALVPGVTSPFVARVFAFTSLHPLQQLAMLALGGFPDFVPVPVANLPVGGVVIRLGLLERQKTDLIGGDTFFGRMFHATQSPIRGCLLQCSLRSKHANFHRMTCVGDLVTEVLDRMMSGRDDGSELELHFEVCRGGGNSHFFSMTPHQHAKLIRPHLAEKARAWNGLGL